MELKDVEDVEKAPAVAADVAEPAGKPLSFWDSVLHADAPASVRELAAAGAMRRDSGQVEPGRPPSARQAGMPLLKRPSYAEPRRRR